MAKGDFIGDDQPLGHLRLLGLLGEGKQLVDLRAQLAVEFEQTFVTDRTALGGIEKATKPAMSQALARARQDIQTLEPTISLESALPEFLRGKTHTSHAKAQLRQRLELFIRMVFSALVDADFLDTEHHFDPSRSHRRGSSVGLDELWKQLEVAQAAFGNYEPGSLNALRHEIYEACVQSAEAPPGIFSLTVPTGGGKTRSGMAFALKHALMHGLDRVIVAIPYTSIIEQTADVYRSIFGETCVLEHHSAIITGHDGCDPLSYQEVWSRLASENWDAPIVVTTTVQLFESLFAHRPSTCRKLHNIARSVLVLDEVQTLPPQLLTPILDVLQDLVEHYSVSVVLCTATQPALQDGPYLKGLSNIREIVPDPPRYFAALRRVHYTLPAADERWDWERVAVEMRNTAQCLAIVNTKPDALQLLDALNDSTALHLSTLLCGAHRRDVLHEIRRRLDIGEPCRLIATQVVEAGVDLDFPLVLRAIGPLDRIVQAAGRCNREGRLASGRVVVFWPAEVKVPPGAYRTGTETAMSLLSRLHVDLHDPTLYRTYFELLYQAVETDVKGIQDLRQALDYPEVAQRFRLIEDDTAAVVVRYQRLESDHCEAENLLRIVRQQAETPRWALRRLQPYLVNVRTRLIPEYYKQGLLSEVTPGLWEWLGRYDLVRGLVVANRDPEELVI